MCSLCLNPVPTRKSAPLRIAWTRASALPESGCRCALSESAQLQLSVILILYRSSTCSVTHQQDNEAPPVIGHSCSAGSPILSLDGLSSQIPSVLE